ncbi:lipoprotein intramolecular transacylase Lit [Saccharophagus degradans]|uniref:DUF1461 domain-containing protein n=1 Tax=Saccharophagus degradans TaxID=86304 RepID=A0AAW7X086_9GAMM|nr:DUF1461 domain-containing protein [Saccharophagus degradans]MDO6420914.1 DUF1461 domain-containing protein [Saccharophagus degradans]MDO6606175.1 DUF1461 domain-containing protein [Saccharophagus degradans]
MGNLNFKSVFAVIFAVHSLLFAIALGWCLLASVQFGYGVWHDHTGINEAIAKYAPQNHYKKGFEHTTKEQRLDMFSQINFAIHNGGAGLEDIYYETATSDGPQKLLREPEVVHLQDVANLIDFFFYPLVYVLLAWPPLAILAIKRSWVPKLKGQVLTLVGLVAAVGAVLLIVGPEKVFNQLHIWVFPDDHQWFFYYQDSLMSTMMFAPHLFGWIGLAWAILIVFIFTGTAVALNNYSAKLKSNRSD